MGALRFRIALLWHEALRFYQKHVIWKILKLIPRHVKYWTVIEVATKDEPGNPGNVTAITMLNRLS